MHLHQNWVQNKDDYYSQSSHLTVSWGLYCFTSYLWDLSYIIHVLITIFHRTGTYRKLKKIFFLGIYFFLPDWLLGSSLAHWVSLSVFLQCTWLIRACLCWTWAGLSRPSDLSEAVRMNFPWLLSSLTLACLTSKLQGGAKNCFLSILWRLRAERVGVDFCWGCVRSL